MLYEDFEKEKIYRVIRGNATFPKGWHIYATNAVVGDRICLLVVSKEDAGALEEDGFEEGLKGLRCEKMN